MKSTRLRIKYRDDKIYALEFRHNDYETAMILKDSEAEKEYGHGKKKD